MEGQAIAQNLHQTKNAILENISPGECKDISLKMKVATPPSSLLAFDLHSRL